MQGVLALPHYPSQQRQSHTSPSNQMYSMSQFYYGQQSTAGPSQGTPLQTQMYTPEHALRPGYYPVIDPTIDSPQQTSTMTVSSVRATDPRG